MRLILKFQITKTKRNESEKIDLDPEKCFKPAK